MNALDELQTLIESWGVRHFTARELCTERRTGTVTVPPRDMWDNIRPALLAADVVRDVLGIPLLVVSGYRSPDYNATVRGSLRSEHMFFKALDLRPLRASVSDLERMRAMLALLVRYDQRSKGHFAADLRILHYDTFCHIDADAMPDKPRTGPKLDFRS